MDDLEPTWPLLLMVLVSTVLSVFGFGFFVFDEFEPRESFVVIEGPVGGVIAGRKRLCVQVAGYPRTLVLDHPAERIPDLAAALEAPVRVRARVKPWSRNPGRASLIELEALEAAGPQTLLAYDEVAAWHRTNRRMGAFMGFVFGTFALGLLLGVLCPRPRRTFRYPKQGAICQRLYASYPKLLAAFLPCLGLVSLFGWGVTQIPKQPLFVFAIPVGLLILGTCLWMLPGLVPGRPVLTIDEEGIDTRVFGRIPWARIGAFSLSSDHLGVHVTEPEAFLADLPWYARLTAWLNQTSGWPPVAVYLLPLATPHDELAAIVGSHGVPIQGLAWWAFED